MQTPHNQLPPSHTIFLHGYFNSAWNLTGESVCKIGNLIALTGFVESWRVEYSCGLTHALSEVSELPG